VARSPESAEVTATAAGAVHAPTIDPDAVPTGFHVSLDDFDGPFDLLLSLISKRERDITEVSLSVVTDEFLAYLRALQNDGSVDALDEASEFLVVAVTLLDLKIASLLPQGELVDAEDVALQYRAFKEVSAWFADLLESESARHVRSVRLEDQYRETTPVLKWNLSVDDFATLALLAMTPKEIPVIGLDHLHAPLVSIREQAAHIVAMLRRGEPVTFRQLIAGADARGVIVARFLALLELYRDAAVGFEQLEPLGELTVRWTAENWSDENLVNLGADYGQ
jgi:segregation and condensation protein A